MDDELLIKKIDDWWARLSLERPLTGKESVQLQNFLIFIKARLKDFKA